MICYGIGYGICYGICYGIGYSMLWYGYGTVLIMVWMVLIY